MLAEADVVDTEAVGQHRLGDHLADRLGMVAGGAVDRRVTEGVEAERGSGAGAEDVEALVAGHAPILPYRNDSTPSSIGPRRSVRASWR